MHTFPKPLTPGEERSCLERMKEGDHEARNTLIERNLRLVAHVTRKYQGTDYEMEDLLSIGTIGLIKAVNTFHPERGSRLATYAAKCIENEILMTFRAEKIVLRSRYGLFGGKEQTQREIADGLGISRSYVSRIEKRALEKMRRGFAEHK